MKLAALILCVVPFICSSPLELQDTTKCVEAFLKVKDSKLGVDEPCRDIAEKKKQELLKNLIETTTKNFTADEVSCIKSKLEKSEYGNLLLARFLQENGGKTVESKEKQKLMEQTSKIRFDIHISCVFPNIAGKFYDDFSSEPVDVKKISKQESNGDYCERKYILEKKLLTIEKLTLSANPKNLDTIKISCDELNKKTFSETENDILSYLLKRPKDRDCSLKVIREGNFVDQFLQFDYVEELHLNAAQNGLMREKFIEVMTKISQGFSKCYLETQ